MVKKTRAQEVRERALRLIEQKKREAGGVVQVAPRVRVSRTLILGGTSGGARVARVAPRKPAPKKEIEAVEEVKEVRPKPIITPRRISEVQERTIRQRTLEARKRVGFGEAIPRGEELITRRTGIGVKAEVTEKKLAFPTRVGEVEISPIEAPEKRDFTFRDIALKESFFPTPKLSREKRGLVDIKKGKREGKVLLQEFIELKGAKLTDPFARRVSKGILFVSPDIRMGRFDSKALLERGLQTKVPITEFGKFGFFGPALATTPEALSRVIGTKQITPVIETRFIARAKPTKDGLVRTDILAELRTGGKTVSGISTQVSKEVGKSSLGVGKGFLIEKEAGKRIITKIKFGGRAKEIGTARLVKELSGNVKASVDLGKVIVSRSASREITRGQIDRALRFGDLKRTTRIRPRKVSKQLEVQDIVGVVRPREEFFEFVGTDVPIGRISKQKIPKRISDPEIKGRIGIEKFPRDGRRFDVVKKREIRVVPKGKKAALTPQLSRQELEQISIQIGGLRGGAKRIIVKEAGKIKPSPKLLISPKIRPFESSIPKISAKIKPSVSEKSKLGLKQVSLLKNLEKAASIQATRSIQKVKQSAKLRQATKQRLRLRTKQRLRLKIKTPRIKIFVPRIRIKSKILPPPLLPIFKFKKAKIKKKDRDRIPFPREDIIISEGFTARAIGLKPIRVTREDVIKIARRERGIGLRRPRFLR